MEGKSLDDWASIKLDGGASREEVREELGERGFSEDRIENALEKAGKEDSNGKPWLAGKSKLSKPVIGFVLLAAASVFAFSLISGPQEGTPSEVVNNPDKYSGQAMVIDGTIEFSQSLSLSTTPEDSISYTTYIAKDDSLRFTGCDEKAQELVGAKQIGSFGLFPDVDIPDPEIKIKGEVEGSSGDIQLRCEWIEWKNRKETREELKEHPSDLLDRLEEVQDSDIR
jgi:hypothetical protein